MLLNVWWLFRLRQKRWQNNRLSSKMGDNVEDVMLSTEFHQNEFLRWPTFNSTSQTYQSMSPERDLQFIWEFIYVTYNSFQQLRLKCICDPLVNVCNTSQCQRPFLINFTCEIRTQTFDRNKIIIRLRNIIVIFHWRGNRLLSTYLIIINFSYWNILRYSLCAVLGSK